MPRSAGQVASFRCAMAENLFLYYLTIDAVALPLLSFTKVSTKMLKGPRYISCSSIVPVFRGKVSRSGGECEVRVSVSRASSTSDSLVSLANWSWGGGWLSSSPPTPSSFSGRSNSWPGPAAPVYTAACSARFDKGVGTGQADLEKHLDLLLTKLDLTVWELIQKELPQYLWYSLRYSTEK